MKASESLQALVGEYREAATALPLSLNPVNPPPAVKRRLMEAIAPPVRRSAPVFTRLFWAAAAIALFSIIVVSLRNAPDPHPVVMNGTKEAPDAHGLLVLTGRAADLSVSGLPKLPAGKVYQLWHIGDDKIPVDQNIFRLDSAGDLRGADWIKNPIATDHLFAITIEPSGGNKHPTMPIYAVGKY